MSILLAAVSYIDGAFWDRAIEAAKDELALDQLLREYIFLMFTWDSFLIAESFAFVDLSRCDIPSYKFKNTLNWKFSSQTKKWLNSISKNKV